MAGMPEMQEQFSATAMDGGDAGNAGAIFGGCLHGPKCRNEGKISGHPIRLPARRAIRYAHRSHRVK